MRKIWLLISFVFLFSALLVITSCEEKTTEPQDNDLAAGNALAHEGFDLLNEKAQELENIDLDNVEEGEDVFAEADYNSIKAKFESAIQKDANNPMAHLGLAILELFSINYDPYLWDLINDIDEKMSQNRLLNHQLQFLGSTPKVLLKYTAKSLQNNDDALSFARVQNLIETNILPKVDNAISHLNYAITLADSNSIILDVDGETIEIDLGEIYLFRSSLYATTAAFKILILYDVDLFDQNNSYDWIDDLKDYDDDYGYNIWDAYEVKEIGGKNYLYLTEYYDSQEEIHNDSLIAEIVKYNMQQRTPFLKFRKTGLAPEIKDDLLSTIADIENSVNYIENETDDQSDDVIKFEYIEEANEDISDHSEDDPDFVKEWKDIHDIIDWLNGLLTETYTFTENEITFQVNMGRMFNPGLDNLKDYLPYYNWNNTNEWVVEEMEYTWQNDNYGYYYEFYLRNQTELITINNVDYVVYEYYDRYIEPIVFLNGPGGNEIDIDEVVPYFPDYTLNGIFPDMTREKLESLTSE